MERHFRVHWMFLRSERGHPVTDSLTILAQPLYRLRMTNKRSKMLKVKLRMEFKVLHSQKVSSLASRMLMGSW